MRREITEVIRRERSTLLKLSCGHHRSIGGHVIPDGVVAEEFAARRRGYDCRDGHCVGSLS